MPAFLPPVHNFLSTLVSLSPSRGTAQDVIHTIAVVSNLSTVVTIVFRTAKSSPLPRSH